MDVGGGEGRAGGVGEDDEGVEAGQGGREAGVEGERAVKEGGVDWEGGGGRTGGGVAFVPEIGVSAWVRSVGWWRVEGSGAGE